MFMKHFNAKAGDGARPTDQNDMQHKLMARTQILKMDLKMLEKYPIVSMFVTPSNPQAAGSLEQNIARWHGVYFVKQGIFQGAILKFQIDFPPSYPMAKPTAYVMHYNHIFHPLIHPKTRQINLDYDFPEWKPGHHWAVHILLSIKKMLHLEPYFKLENKEHLVWNKEAHEAFCNRFEEEFVERAN